MVRQHETPFFNYGRKLNSFSQTYSRGMVKFVYQGCFYLQPEYLFPLQFMFNDLGNALVLAVSQVNSWSGSILIISVRPHHSVFHNQHFGMIVKRDLQFQQSLLKRTRLPKILSHTLWIKTSQIDRQTKCQLLNQTSSVFVVLLNSCG